MLHIVSGPAGSGKSQYILSKLKECANAGKTCFYIVPEQQSVVAERAVCHLTGSKCALNCEVLNFERLPNRVRREAGDLAVSYIDKAGRDLLTLLALIAAKPKLYVYGRSCGSIDFVKQISKLIARLKTEGLTSKQLYELSNDERIAVNGHLCRKLHDLAVICEEYEIRTSGEVCDPIDALSSLAVILKTNDFFVGTCVFIDGYYTFTGQEYAIIKQLCRQCKEVYISFVSDGTREIFDDNNACKKRVSGFASYDSIDMPAFIRSASPDIRHVEHNLWNDCDAAEPKGDVKVIYAKNIFEECEAIASEILTAVKGGMRYRDIAVLAGSKNEYADILESVLEQNGIPCFSSHKEDVVSKPLFAYILSVLQIAAEDFSISAVRRCLKSGFAPLSPEQCDFLLRYVEMWSIRGKAWYAGGEWLMNPDGYEAPTESGEKIRVYINKARDEFLKVVLPICEDIKAKDATVGDMVKALYCFIVKQDLQDAVDKRASAFDASGDRDGANKETQVYDCFITLLDQIYMVAADEKLPISRFCEMIEVMCAEYTVGSIPSSADAVTVADPRLFRAGECAMTVICGCNDGVFPSYSSADAFFDNDELSLLESTDVNLSPSRSQHIRRERFLFYNACVSPTQKLVVTCPIGNVAGEKKRPSMGVLRLLGLFKGFEPYYFGGCKNDYIYSLYAAKSHYPMLQDGRFKSGVAELLKQNGITVSQPEPIFMPDVTVNFAQPAEFALSPSSFERYVYCPFSYFALKLMRLKKSQRIEFAAAETGTLIHSALENYMKSCCSGGAFVPLDGNGCSELADSVIANHFPEHDNKRYAAALKGIKRTLLACFDNLANEFAVCDFKPIGFEVKIGSGEGDTKKAMTVTACGSTVYVRGSADRVDKVTIDGKDYIRIVDYKTGEKDIKFALIQEGLEMQMPMYLFAMCDTEHAEPAGCLYYMAKIECLERERDCTDEEFAELVKKSIERRGIVSSNKEVIMSYDRTSNTYRPVNLKNDGEVNGSSLDRVYDGERFAALRDELSKQMVKAAEGIFGGRMNVSPKRLDDNHDACKYCKYRVACRYEGR